VWTGRLFHLDDLLPNNYVTLTVHFLLHGVHHLLPMDPMRLVFPPVLTAILIVPFYKLFRCFLETPEALCLTAGGLTGYMVYDLTHYYLHHSGKPFLSHFGSMKTYHLAHHYKNHELGYGITSKIWDYVFGTLLDDSPTGMRKPGQPLKTSPTN
jgi:4-hydroxysphinganine ceramide fatty acyl 2-hydroxylase